MQEVGGVEAAVHSLAVAPDAALVQSAVLRRGGHECLHSAFHGTFDFSCL